MTSPLKVHWKKSIESPLENESPLEKVHSYSETTSGEAGGYAQNFIFEQKRKEEKT